MNSWVPSDAAESVSIDDPDNAEARPLYRILWPKLVETMKEYLVTSTTNGGRCSRRMC